MMRTTLSLGPDCPAGSEVAFAGIAGGLAGVAIPGGIAWVHPDVLVPLPEDHVSPHLEMRELPPFRVLHEIPPGIEAQVPPKVKGKPRRPEDLPQDDISRIRRSHNSIAKLALQFGRPEHEIRDIRLGARAGEKR